MTPKRLQIPLTLMCRIPEDIKLHSHRRHNLYSRLSIIVF
jgi:hypothetical protein